MQEYIAYNKKSNRNVMRLFGISLHDLLSQSEDMLTESQQDFVDNYQRHLPLGRGGCVMNRICYTFEDKFDSVKHRRIDGDFDYSVLKSDAEYSMYEYNRVEKIYHDYKQKMKGYVSHLQYEREDKFDVKSKVNQINDEFLEECSKVCPNEDSLCNIVLDIVYNTAAGKMFAWAMCGNVIVRNLTNRFGNTISFPVRNDEGDIYYGGLRFELMTIDLED